jgi:hypothetical protein
MPDLQAFEKPTLSPCSVLRIFHCEYAELAKFQIVHMYDFMDFFWVLKILTLGSIYSNMLKCFLRVFSSFRSFPPLKEAVTRDFSVLGF